MRRHMGTPGRQRQEGTALLLVVLVAGLLLASSAVSLEAFLLTMRVDRGGIDRLVDFHLADTALTLCERHVARTFVPRAPVSGNTVGPSGTPRTPTGPTMRDGEDMPEAPATPATRADAAGDRRATSSAVALSDEDAMARLRAMMARRAEPTRWRHPDAADAGGPPRWRAGRSAEPSTASPAVLSIALPVVRAAGRRAVTPVCLIESWVDAPGVGRVLLLTAHVPAGRPAAGSGTWLQSIAMLTASGRRRQWRAVAEPPTPWPGS